MTTPKSTTMVCAWIFLTAPLATALAKETTDTKHNDDDAADFQPAHADADKDPVFLHSSALENELDNKPYSALNKLRKAAELSPKDEVIAFDLARVAYEADSENLAEDVAGFLALEPSTPDSSLLRAYILMDQGKKKEALQQAERVLQFRPEDKEALSIQSKLAPPPLRTRQEKFFSGVARTGIQADSNVTVLPQDAPSQQQGMRGTLDVAAILTGGGQHFRLDGGAFLSAASHLNNRDSLKTYDSASGTAFMGVRYEDHGFVGTLEVIGTSVGINNFQSEFMRDFRGRISMAFPSGAWYPGAYFDGGYRDFLSGNPNNDPNDRDGARLETGGMLNWQRGYLAIQSRAGVLEEMAEGNLQKTQGVAVSTLVMWRPDPFRFALGVRYTLRDYTESTRLDNLLQPSARVSFQFTQQLAALASYNLTRNLSQANFDYIRHMATVGMEAKW